MTEEVKQDIYSVKEGGFDWEKWNSYDKEWWVQLKMDLKEVRLLYSTVSFIWIIMRELQNDLLKRKVI